MTQIMVTIIDRIEHVFSSFSFSPFFSSTVPENHVYFLTTFNSSSSSSMRQMKGTAP